MDFEITLLEIAVVFAAFAPTLLQWFRTGRIDLLGTQPIYAITTVLGFVAPVAGFLDGTDPFLKDNPIDIDDPKGLVIKALSIVVATICCFHVGYFWQKRSASAAPARVQRPFRWNLRAFGAVQLGYTLAALIAFAVGVQLVGGLGVLIGGFTERLRLMAGLNYLFQAINLLIIVSLVWWYYILRHDKPLASLRFWAYVAFTTVLVSLQGSKFVLMFLCLCLALLYHEMKRPISSLRVIASAAVVFVALALYGLYTREYLVLGGLSSIYQLDSEGIATLSQREYGGNFMQLQTLCILIEKIPRDLQFTDGSAITSLLALPVPRSLWPNKPLTDTGLFTLAFWPHRWLIDSMTLPPGLVGDFYMNFGTTGTLVGMFGYGAALGRIEGAAKRSDSGPLAMLLYAIGVATIPHFLRGEFASAMAWALIYLVPTAVAIRLVRIPEPVEAPEPAEALLSRVRAVNGLVKSDRG